MDSIFLAFGALILLFSFSASFVVLARYFFPSVDQFIPEDWKGWLTFRYISYFVLAGSISMWIGTR